MSNIAKSLGYCDLVDIGSGDGRIAFSGKILDMNTHSIEIDEMLVDLQNVIVAQTNQNFDPICYDALEFDYSKLQLTSPAFFIGGLPQMGGDLLQQVLLKKLKEFQNFKKMLVLFLQVLMLNVNYQIIWMMGVE